MSNKIYEGGFYNEEQKKRFLKYYIDYKDDSSVKNYTAVLSRAQYVESRLNKDLYDFNSDEIEQLMKYFNCTTITSAYGRLNYIQNYINWGIAEGLTKSVDNPLNGLISREFCKRLVGDYTRVLATEQDVLRVAESCLNFQDKAVILAIFEGIGGKELSELTNLRRADIDEGQLRIKLTDSKHGTRYMTFKDDYIIRNLIRANEEETYHMWSSNKQRKRERVLIALGRSSYVIKHIVNRHGSDEDTPVKSYGITTRLRHIQEHFSSDFEFLNPTNLRNSGMLRMARDIYWATGKFNIEDVRNICLRYHVSVGSTSGEAKLKNNFLNIETIGLVYGGRPE
ncbi:hypothetical protein K0T92_04870 [Paenibacillus oenotherae]|uniref:Integrase n=1 Tax=Paenibacillus oenotherae TaxID=1435645 RepID=A0ABS7D294_9BACL|nr:hypothetical protein [Paenibacillus oenotherae]MBW7474065.1 hypothetical protein [Paenibacillus oenotherae]